MTVHQPITRPVFPADALERVADLYPLQAGLLHHQLRDHELLSLDALARLADGQPARQVE